jgi:hypothetical protein
MFSKRSSALTRAIFILTAVFSTAVFGLSNSGKVPVLLYHSWDTRSPCDYANNPAVALAQDLETMRLAGYTVVPAYWIAEWVRGVRDGSTLPAKVVGLTFDDGANADWIDNAIPNHPCAPLKSFKTVLQEFKNAHPDLPWYSPHAAIFVIGSTMARLRIDDHSPDLEPYGTYGVNNFMHDTWWGEANTSGIALIYNHSTDHDHPSIWQQYWDSNLGVYIAVGGYGDGNWVGQNNFARIDTAQEAAYEVVNSAQYIQSKIAGEWPDLFAYPNGAASDYMRSVYFPNGGSAVNTFAAFCTERGTTAATYVSRASDPFCMGRFTFRWSWTSQAGLIGILNGSQ